MTTAEVQQRTDLVLDWLASNPGWHAPVEVARALDLTTHQAAATLLHLDRQARVARRRDSRTPRSVYAAITQGG